MIYLVYIFLLGICWISVECLKVDWIDSVLISDLKADDCRPEDDAAEDHCHARKVCSRVGDALPLGNW